ncbi:MAG: stage II sporulation protein M [Chitinophagaceae bacterium]|nr:stage II sporulation protein M [Chitinophagaceae bacterium]
MREGKFIDQNIDRWKDYLVDSKDPDEQADRFVHLVDDLSYAKTFYPTSKTTQFLNGLAARQFQKLYQHRNLQFGRLIQFWRYELPLLYGRYHRIYLFVLAFFTLCVLMGVLSSMHDQTFVRSILGDGYVDMTEDNIQKGDPFGVYKNSNEFGMFVNIAANNIRVAMMTFSLGLLAGIGTLYMLFTNGVMLGSFQYMFFAKGLGWQSILVIWIHGTLEISAIVIAGTAGMILGASFLFPGTYSRLESLRRGSRDAVKIIFGLIPFFLLAAFFEGFVTRHTEMPVWLSLMILIGSAATIIWYFIIYPVLLRRSGIRFEKGKIIFPQGE